MSRRHIYFALILVLLFLVVFIPGRLRRVQEPGTAKPVIAATIFPLYDIVRNVGGDSFDHVLITPPGASPHTFEPTPSVVAELQDAARVYAIGHGLDDWVSSLAEAAGAPVVVVDRDIRLLAAAEESHGHGEEADGHEDGADGFDPHYWLNAANGLKIAGTVAADLAAAFPDKKDAIAANLAAYVAAIDAADRETKAILGTVADRDLVTLHDAWYYFAEGYGLKIVGSFEPSAGREPTPKYLAELTAALKIAGTKVVYSEPQMSTANLASFAADNGLTIAILDPIGGTPGRDSYLKLLTENARVIADNQR